MKRAQSFINTILKDALGIELYRGHVEEEQGRGQIHFHMLIFDKD